MLRTSAICVVSGLGLALGACSPSGIAPERAPQETVLLTEEIGPESVVPSERCGAYWIVEVELNGVSGVRMLLDTGSGASVVSTGFAEQYAEAALESTVLVTGAEGEELPDTGEYRVGTLRVGDIQLSGFDAVVLDLSSIADALGSEIDGILGYRAFFDVLLKVDYPQNRVTVRRGTLSSDDFDRLVEMRSGPGPAVRLDIAGYEYSALIDTAGSSTLALPNWERLPLAEAPVVVGTSVSVGGVNTLECGRLDADVRVGAHTFTDLLFAPTTGGPRLGTDMLEGMAVTFDQRSRLVRFDRQGDPGTTIATPGRRGLGIGFDRRASEWEIVWLDSERFEFPGLAIGDLVIAVDGLPVSQLGCGRFRAMVRESDELDLTVRRDGVETNKRVLVHTLVR